MADGKPSRPWQDIVAEMLAESDANRMIMLAEELNKALAKERMRSSGSPRNEKNL